ncbi:coatomer subunit alpha-1 [Tanacetum coccineum]
MERYKLNDLKSKGFNSIQEMFDRAFKRVNTFEDFRTELVEGKEKRAGTELAQEITKKQKIASTEVKQSKMQKGSGGSAVFVARSLQTPFVKYIVWSNDMETMALLSKHAIVIASKKLDHRCTLHETIHVKGGAWDDNGRTKNFERLSFLYLITGNTNKLGKMLKIAEVKNDVMGQFHNALYLGIIQERVTILENSGHLQLAYVTASTHGLHDIADRIAEKLGGNLLILPKGKVPSLLVSPVPITRGGDWPLLRVMKGIFEGGLENKGVIDEDKGGDKADWGEEMDLDNVNGFKNQDTQEIQEEDEAESSLRVLGRMVLFGLKEKNEFISDEDYYESDRKETEVTCRHLDHVNMLGLSKTTFRLHFLIKIELMRHYNVSATFDVSDLSPYSGESEDEENSRTSFSQAGEDDAGH